MAKAKISKTTASVDSVLGVASERVTVGEHSFDVTPPKVLEKTRFANLFKAEEDAVSGDEKALRRYAHLVAEVLNARNPAPAEVDVDWVLDQEASEVTEAVVAIGLSRGNRKSQQAQN